jgi:hypothetical protein
MTYHVSVVADFTGRRRGITPKQRPTQERRLPDHRQLRGEAHADSDPNLSLLPSLPIAPCARHLARLTRPEPRPFSLQHLRGPCHRANLVLGGQTWLDGSFTPPRSGVEASHDGALFSEAPWYIMASPGLLLDVATLNSLRTPSHPSEGTPLTLDASSPSLNFPGPPHSLDEDPIRTTRFVDWTPERMPLACRDHAIAMAIYPKGENTDQARPNLISQLEPARALPPSSRSTVA